MPPSGPTLPTFEQFQSDILPVIVHRWQQSCFCRNPQFCKLLSFNFEDYTRTPAALLDAESLIDHLIRKHFKSPDGPISTDGRIIQIWQCPQCDSAFRESYAEYSIAMSRAFLRPLNPEQQLAPTGHYLLGFHAFRDFSPAQVHDFRPATSIESFLDALTRPPS